MAGMRARLFVAFDAGSVSGGAVARGPGGYAASHGRVALDTGRSTSPFTAGMRGWTAGRTLRELARGRTAPVCLPLPDGMARLALVDFPGDVTAQEYARFRLGPGLPYPVDEAVIDVLPLAPGRAVVAAVRRSVVEAYEAAAEAAGIAQDRMDLTPLAAVSGLLREPGPSALTVDVVLGDAAVCLAAHEAGALRVLRNRRRDLGPDEPSRLAEEVRRPAVLAGDGAAPVRVVGHAPGGCSSWRAAGRATEPGWRTGERARPSKRRSWRGWAGPRRTRRPR